MTGWQQSLTGLTDAANTPSQIIVVYPLAVFVDEDMLARDMKQLELEKPQPPSKDSSNGGPKLKSTAPTANPTGYGARPGSLHRVFLMRDARKKESCKYGFAEFWTLEDAVAAVAKFNASRSFSVAAVPVNISHIHMGVFLPEAEGMPPDTRYMSFKPLFNPSLRVRYRDARLYPSEEIVTTQPPAGAEKKSSAYDNKDGKKSKKRKAEGTAGATTKKTSGVMAGQFTKWNRKGDELHGQDPPSHNSDAPNTAPGAPMKFSLSGPKIGEPLQPLAGFESTPTPDMPSATEAAEPTPVSYRNGLQCLLCMFRYPSLEILANHERTKMHVGNIRDEETVKKARQRLTDLGKLPPQPPGESQPAPEPGLGGPAAPSTESQYRDRAKERREANSQPKKPVTFNLPSKKASPPPAPKPKESKGAGMLQNMGWKDGAGLGANGQGRTETIPQNAYQERAGLGAEDANLGDAAKLAEKRTKGTNNYAEYLSDVQDRARQRFNKMG